MSLRHWLSRMRQPGKRAAARPVPNRAIQQSENETVTGDMELMIDKVKSFLGDSDDFVVRRFQMFGRYDAVLFYYSSLVDQRELNTEIIRSLMYLPRHLEGKEIDEARLEDVLLNEALFVGEATSSNQMNLVLERVTQGKTAILVQGMDTAVVVGTRQIDKRSIDQPATEQVIRGPREGFIEHLDTNISLLRYRLQSADFCVKTLTVGRITKTRVSYCYIKGIANDALVHEVEDRLNAIDIDGVLDTGYVEQFIEDNHWSPFPQVQNTERPDKAVANMLEGRIVILADGSPLALIVPTVFNQFYQAAEDYSERFLLVSFIRLARLVALVFSLVTPSLYVSVISFNPELIPTDFAVAVAGGRAGVPFPSVVEVLIMEISMEVLREATVRLPQQVGGALSIVGVLVIGQAAVAAGFVSPITVVVIALTTIGSFATPAYNAALALRLLRFPLILLAGMFGLYGVTVGLILIANHLLSLKSFGIPYLSPLVPGNFQAMKDTVFRAPLWWMTKRPSLLHTQNDTRVSNDAVEKIKQPPSNTLDPLKVGNQREELSDGISPPNNDAPGGSRSH